MQFQILIHGNICNKKKDFCLRGGGVCTSRDQQRVILLNQEYTHDDQNTNIIKGNFIQQFDGKVEEIKQLQQITNIERKKEVLMKFVKWFSESEQFFYYFLEDRVTIKIHLSIFQEGFLTVLQMVPDLILSEKFLSLKILKFCNSLSRILAQYFTSEKNDDKLKNHLDWKNLIEEILETIKSEGEHNLFYNEFCYEMSVIKLCIEAIPIKDAQNQEQELLKNSLIGIFTSALSLSLSEELIGAIKDGVLLLYSKFQQEKSKEQFKFCLYFEQLKWSIINEIEKGANLQHVKQSITKIFLETVSKIKDWNILYSWIKMVSDLVIYKPQINKIRFNLLIQSSGDKIQWEDAANLKYIKVLNYNKNVAEILEIQNPKNNIEIQLNLIYSKLRLLQRSLLMGDQELPPFLNYYQINQANQINYQGEPDNSNLLESLNSIQFLEMCNYLDNLIKMFITYLSNYQQISSEQLKSNKSQLDPQDKINNFKFLLNLNQQLCQQINGYLVFNCYFDALVSFIKQLSLLFNRKQIELDKNYFIFFFSQFRQTGVDCQINPVNLEKENLIQTIKQFDENIFQEEIANLQSTWSKIGEVFGRFLLQEKQKSLSIQQTIELTAQYFEKIYSPFRIFFQSSQKHLLEDQNLILKAIQCKDLSLEQELIITDQEFLQNQTYYLTLITALKIQKEMSWNLMEALQDDLAFKDFQQLTRKEDLQFKITLPTYLDLFYQFHEGNIKMSLQQIDKYKSILEQHLEKYQEDSSIYYFEEIFQLSILVQNEILTSIENNLMFKQNLHQIKEIIFKKSKKTHEQFKVSFSQLEAQINIFFDSLSKLDEQESINFQDRMRDLQSSAQTIQLQLMQLQGAEVTEIQNELGRLILLLNHILVCQNDELNENELVINENLKKFAEIIQQLWSLHQNQIRILNQEDIKEITNDDETRQNQQQQVNQITEEVCNKISELQNLINTIKIPNLKSKIELLYHLKMKSKIHSQIQETSKEYLKIFSEIIGQLQNILNCEKQNSVGSLNSLYSYLKQIIEMKSSQHLELKLVKIIGQCLPFMVCTQNSLSRLQAKQKQKKTGWIEKINDIMSENFWKVKEGFIFQSILLLNSLPEQNKQIIAKRLILISAQETDPRIIKTIRNKEVISQMIQSFERYWNDIEPVIESDLNTQLSNLQQLQNDLKVCQNEQKKEELLLEHQRLEQQIEGQLKNITFVGETMGIVIRFLIDMKKDLSTIKSNLEKVQQQLDEFGLDIKFLRGKSPVQLLEIRMYKILQQKQMFDRQQVYVQLRTKEYIPNQNQEEIEESTLFNDKKSNLGEVEEFLSQQKDSLLIHGPAGSGKSSAAQRIEEFFWQQHYEHLQKTVDIEKQNTRTQIIPLFPIFIQLSSLKNPLTEAVEETLQSSSYNFDQKQIVELKEFVAQGRAKIIFILDSYDELSKDYNQQNINISNKLKNWRFDSTYIQNINHYSQELSMISYYPKIITTTRTESLQQSNYNEWFLSDSNLDYKKYKEVQILKFDFKQQFDYLQQFFFIQIKMTVKELLEAQCINIMLGPKFVNYLEQTQSKIQEIVQTKDIKNYEKALNNEQIKNIIKVLKENQNIIIKKELEEYFIKQLSQLWSVKQFENYIKEFNLQQLLATPFMMKIVVEVLPRLTQELSSLSTKRQSFMKNYCDNFYASLMKPKKDYKILFETLEKLKQINSESYKTMNFSDTNQNTSYFQTKDQSIQKPNQKPNQKPGRNQVSEEQQNRSLQPNSLQKSEYEQDNSKQQSVSVSDNQKQFDQELDEPNSGDQQNLNIQPNWPSGSEYEQENSNYNSALILDNQKQFDQEHDEADLEVKQNQYIQPNQFSDSEYEQNNSNYKSNYASDYLKDQEYDEANSNIQQNQYIQPNQFQYSEYHHEKNQQTKQILPTQQQDNTKQQLVLVSDNQKQFDQEYDEANQSIKKSQNEINSFQEQKTLISKVKQEIQICSQNRWQILKNNNFRIESVKSFVNQSEEDIILQSLKQFFLTSYDFYEVFYINYIKRNLKKTSNTKIYQSLLNYQSQTLHYSMILAMLLMKKQIIGVDYEQQGLIKLKISNFEKENEFFELFDETAPNAGLFQQFRKCMPLKQKGTFIGFEHKSIQEYLFAKTILDSMNNILLSYQNIKAIRIQIVGITHTFNTKQLIIQFFKKYFAIIKWKQLNTEQEINSIFKNKMKNQDHQEPLEQFLTEIHKIIHQLISSPLNQFTLQNDFYLGVLRFLSEKIKSNYQMRKILRFLLLLSKYFDQFVIISSNCFQILVFIQEFFKGFDFSNIKIKDISLIGLKCLGCNFINSSFNNVRITGANFDFCNLSSVKWENIITQELPIQYYNYPLLKAQFSANGEFIAVLTQQQQIVVSLASNGQTILYFPKNIEEFRISDFCWCHTMQIIGFCFDKVVQCKIIGSKSVEFSPCFLNERVKTIQFSKRNSFLAAACLQYLYIINPNQKKLEAVYTLSIFEATNVSCIDFSPDERQLVVCGGQDFLMFRNEHNSWNQIIQQQTICSQQITNVCYSPDGTCFATSSFDEFILIWNKFGFIQRKIQCFTGITKMQYSPDGRYLACGGVDKKVYLFNPNTGTLLGGFNDHTDLITSVSFSPFRNIFLSASKDCSLRQWHPETNTQLNEYLHGHDEQILFVTITKDRNRVISKGKDKKIIQWKFQTGQICAPYIILNGCINCSNSSLCDDCGKSPILSINNDQEIATGGCGDQIQIIDAFSGKLANSIHSDVRPGQIQFLHYHSNLNELNDGQMKKYNIIISQTSQDIIQIHDLNSGDIIRKYNHSSPISNLFIRLSENSQMSQQQFIIIIDIFANFSMLKLESLEEVVCDKQLIINKIRYKQKDSQSVKVQCTYAKTECNILLLALNNNIIYQFEIDTLQLKNEIEHQDQVQGMSFYKLNAHQFLITYNKDLAFKIYYFDDWCSEFNNKQLLCHYNDIIGLVGVDNTNYLISWSLDKTIKVWSIVQSSDLQQLKKRLKANLDSVQNELEILKNQNQICNTAFSNLSYLLVKTQIFLSKFNNHLQQKQNFEKQQQDISQQLQEIEDFQQKLLDIDRMNICGVQLQIKREDIQNINKQADQLINELQDIQKKQAKNRDEFLKCLNQELQVYCSDIQNEVNSKNIPNLQEQINHKERDCFTGQMQSFCYQIKQKIYGQKLKFTEILCLSKYPQPTQFVGTKFSQAQIISSTFSNLTQIWMYKQKKFENLRN